MSDPQPLLSVRGVTQTFAIRGRSERVTALDCVELHVARGERLGVVGESGSGKSTLARAIVGLQPVEAGEIVFDDIEITGLGARELRRLRARLQLVLQDPGSSLDPRMTVRQLVAEGPAVHAIGAPEERYELIRETLDRCGIPERLFDRRPSALSGGQRQRVALARSLVLRPALVLLDEPVSALDVSVQAQVLNLLLDLQEGYRLTYVFIVHDLAVARWFCDRIAVMSKGSIVEIGRSTDVFESPQHPYTRELLAASAAVAAA